MAYEELINEHEVGTVKAIFIDFIDAAANTDQALTKALETYGYVALVTLASSPEFVHHYAALLTELNRLQMNIENIDEASDQLWHALDNQLELFWSQNPNLNHLEIFSTFQSKYTEYLKRSQDRAAHLPGEGNVL